MEERKFKVGDKVRIIKNIDDKENDRYIGKEYYIDWIGGYRFNDGDCKYIYHLDAGVELIAAEEELELIETVEELAEKPTPLTWLQIQERMGKPVWDNYDKKWRVIYMYREIKGNAKVVEFTDSSACYTYKEDRFYDEEVGE